MGLDSAVIEEIVEDADERMGKTLDALQHAFAKIRTGRANPSLLDTVFVEYYGAPTPLNQVASVSVEDARTLAVSPWEKPLVPIIEKAILKSDIGITPVSSGDVIRVPLPPLTEENRRDLAKQAKAEAENSRISIRNIRREAIADVRELVKEKEATEDDARRAEDRIQKVTDKRVAQVDTALAAKESDLMDF
jgi:ribosome recycling factor